MSLSENLAFSPEEFSGRARLFPLPNLVVFPHVMQPLHIFEPRYRAMLEDSLADDRLIGMALPAPGWENDYEGRLPLPRGNASSHRRRLVQRLSAGFAADRDRTGTALQEEISHGRSAALRRR